MSEAKHALLEEISLPNPNVTKIRRLCRESPGLIAETGLRCRIWCFLLLGTDRDTVDAEPWEPTPEACKEQQVLHADLTRTRAEVPPFRTDLYRNMLHDIMRHFCVTHGVEYKQGMNEICAPFIALHPPQGSGTNDIDVPCGDTDGREHATGPVSGSVSYALFEAFLFRYHERYYCVDHSSFLFKAFRLFHILLCYHDPKVIRTLTRT